MAWPKLENTRAQLWFTAAKQIEQAVDYFVLHSAADLDCRLNTAWLYFLV